MSTSSENATKLRALAKLISEGVEDTIAEYQKAGQEVPSVDSVALGLLDDRETSSPKLKNAIKTIQGACGQLVASVEAPGVSITMRAMAHYDSSCLNIALTAKIADLLIGHRDGLSLDELSKTSGVDKDKLGRVLRYLATRHVFREVSPNIFANNRISVKLLSEDAVSSAIGHCTDEIMASSAKLSEAVLDEKLGPSRSPDHTAFAKAFDCNVFAYYQSDEGRERGLRFNRAMIGTSAITGAGQIADLFPWDKLPKGARLCDVGGGRGHVTLGILKKHSHLRAAVQDLPEVVKDAEQFWQTEMPGAIKNNQVDFAAIDFLKESPLKECDVYYMRFIVHDWPDEECVKILSNIRAVMATGNRLLIHEWVMQPLVRQDKPSVKEAPQPLLANYGIGGTVPYLTDINMMCALNARERTLAEFIELGRRAHLSFVKMYGDDMGLIEFQAA